MKEYLNRSREGRKGMRGKDAAHAGNFWCPIDAAASSHQPFACFATSVQTLHFGSGDAGSGEHVKHNNLQPASYGMLLKNF